MSLIQELSQLREFNKKHSILIIDDSPINLLDLSELLEQRYNVFVAADGATGLRLAIEHQPQLILLDIVMPGLSGYDVLRTLKSGGQTANIGVIFLTGLSSPEHEARGIKMGGVDFISKPFNPEVLLARVAAHLRQLHLLQELETLATIDPLTGLANRRYFDHAFINEFNRARRTDSIMTLAMIDIDYFKQYNDVYGHAQGDAALKMVAKALITAVKRGGDIAARYGGEEFALVMPDTDLSGGKLLATMLLDTIQSLKIDHIRSTATPWLTVSIGLASTQSDFAGSNPPHIGMVELADSRLYQAKAAGRNTVRPN